MSKIGAIAQSDTSIVTDGLEFNMDSSKFTCYPRTGTTCTDLVNSEDGTLTNGPTFENNNLGVIDFDGTDDLIRFNNSASPFNIPVTNAGSNPPSKDTAKIISIKKPFLFIPV